MIDMTSPDIYSVTTTVSMPRARPSFLISAAWWPMPRAKWCVGPSSDHLRRNVRTSGGNLPWVLVVIQTYKFIGVNVKSVGNTQLTYEGGDASKFEVGFNSLYWQCEDHKKGGFTGQK